MTRHSDDHNNWQMDSTDVLFLGAGFSRAVTNGKAPLMSGFFNGLDVSRFGALGRFLNDLVGTPEEANVEDVLHKLDQIVAAPNSAGSFFAECQANSPAIRKEFDEFLIERLQDLIPAPGWAANLLFRVSASTTVVTTNYDTLAEKILCRQHNLRHGVARTNCKHCRMCAILNAGCGCSDSDVPYNDLWKGSLLKLHGSIAWGICTNRECTAQTRLQRCLIPDSHCTVNAGKPCECCDQPYSPAVVAPSMVKRFDKFGTIDRMWEAARFAVESAENVMFFGYSCPKSDVAILEMLRQASRKTRKLRRVAVIDVNPDGPIEQLEELLPDEVGIIPFKVPTDKPNPDWYGTPQSVEAKAHASEN